MYEVISELLPRLDALSREVFEERAGSAEFEGLLPREEAESYALLDVLRGNPFALTGLTLIRIDRGTETRWVLATGSEGAWLLSCACGAAECAVGLTDVMNAQFKGAAMLVAVRDCAE
jgi:hypothetical protein